MRPFQSLSYLIKYEYQLHELSYTLESLFLPIDSEESAVTNSDIKYLVLVRKTAPVLSQLCVLVPYEEKSLC